MNSGSLAGRHAIITGAGRGIGAACAELFADEGAKVLLVSRTEAELRVVADAINRRHGGERALCVAGDVSSESLAQKVFQTAEAHWGGADILVNNAAIAPTGEFTEFTAAQWDHVMAINLRGPFLFAREAFRTFKKGGAIVNLSSLGGLRGTTKFKGLTAYGVSKFGMVGLTESLAVEGREKGIRVNCVAPGAVETRMLKEAAPFLKTHTLPLDVAQSILFLCDENRARTVTGTVVEIHSNVE
ncbi:MAG: SDR family NAD(P)-dependent oxidoreductase [Bacteriovoracia bacterium]